VSHLVCKCRILTTIFASVKKSILPSCLCRASNDITKTLDTPQRLFLNKRSHLTGSTNLFPLKKQKKMDFGEECSPTHCQVVLALPKPLWGSVLVPCAPFWGSATLILENSGFVEVNKGRIPQFLKVVGFE
jgi:hypothetical protein